MKALNERLKEAVIDCQERKAMGSSLMCEIDRICEAFVKEQDAIVCSEGFVRTDRIFKKEKDV